MTIRFSRFGFRPNKVIFAKGNILENIYLFFRGYRPHRTAFGWVMKKKP